MSNNIDSLDFKFQQIDRNINKDIKEKLKSNKLNCKDKELYQNINRIPKINNNNNTNIKNQNPHPSSFLINENKGKIILFQLKKKLVNRDSNIETTLSRQFLDKDNSRKQFFIIKSFFW